MTWYVGSDGVPFSDGEDGEDLQVRAWSELRASLDIDESKLAEQRAYTNGYIDGYRAAEARGTHGEWGPLPPPSPREA